MSAATPGNITDLPQLNRDLTTVPTTSSGFDGHLFDPEAGITVVEPLDSGVGWWAGAPSAVWTGDSFYLSYRLRRPQPERGGTTQIAVSTDGVTFEPIWTAQKEAFGTSSIERCALVPAGPDTWRLYISYVDGTDGRWRIDVMEAATPDAFDPSSRRRVLTAADIGAEGVKDPWVARRGDRWLMIASFAPTPAATGVDAEQLHGAKDVYNTGLTKSLTGLATSEDGLTWQWEGSILEPSSTGWDSYAARLNTLLGADGGWLGLYDGSASVEQNYEERCAVVTSTDLRSWKREGDAPTIGAAGGPGTVRSRPSKRPTGRASTTNTPGPTAPTSYAPSNHGPRHDRTARSSHAIPRTRGKRVGQARRLAGCAPTRPRRADGRAGVPDRSRNCNAEGTRSMSRLRGLGVDEFGAVLEQRRVTRSAL